MARNPKATPIAPADPPADDAPERPALAVLRDIKDGNIQGKSLSPSDRRDIVGALIAQGASVPEIAHTLGVSDRTIQRDLDALRSEHSARINPSFVLEAIGALRMNTQTRLGKLDRIASDPSASHQDKIKAVRASHRTELEYIHRLQTLGTLPHAISERMAVRGPSALHVHQHLPGIPGGGAGAGGGVGAGGDEFDQLESHAEMLARVSDLAARSSDGEDAKTAKRARSAAKRVQNTLAKRRPKDVRAKPTQKKEGGA